MVRLIGTLAAIFTLAACSSGVSNDGAGAAGTNCNPGDLDLICTATLSVSPSSVDACADAPAEGEDDEEATVVLPGTTTGNMTVTVTDPLGEFDNTFQGMTFQTFDVSFQSGQGGAPNLGQRRFTQTINITISDAQGSGSATLPIVDQVTKQQFRDQSSCSTAYPYVVTVRATGQDFATNTPVVAVARTTIEIGNVVDSGGGE